MMRAPVYSNIQVTTGPAVWAPPCSWFSAIDSNPGAPPHYQLNTDVFQSPFTTPQLWRCTSQFMAQIKQKHSCSDIYFIFVAEITGQCVLKHDPQFFLISKSVCLNVFKSGSGLRRTPKFTVCGITKASRNVQPGGVTGRSSIPPRIASIGIVAHLRPPKAEQNRVSSICHNVLIGISEPPTGRHFESVRLEEHSGITQNMQCSVPHHFSLWC